VKDEGGGLRLWARSLATNIHSTGDGLISFDSILWLLAEHGVSFLPSCTLVFFFLDIYIYGVYTVLALMSTSEFVSVYKMRYI